MAGVLVVGGTGVLGRALVPLLLADGHRVTVYAPARRLHLLPAGVGRIPGDLLAWDADRRLREVLTGQDAVVNAAGAMPADPGSPGAWTPMARVRREGTRALARAVRWARVPRLVQLSITMAYPDGGDSWLDESTPLDPDPARAEVVGPVAAAEDAVGRLLPDGVSVLVLRAARLVGPGTFQDAQRAGLRAGRLPVRGDADRFVSMVHVADAAAAVAAAVVRPSVTGTLNVSAEPLRVGAYFSDLARAEQAAAPRTEPDAPADLPSHRVTARAARARLGWHPVCDIVPARRAPTDLDHE